MRVQGVTKGHDVHSFTSVWVCLKRPAQRRRGFASWQLGGYKRCLPRLVQNWGHLPPSEIWNSDRTLKHLYIWNLDHWYISETIKYRDSETLKWFWNIWISEPSNYYTPNFHFNRISKSHGKNHYHWAICDRQPCSLFQSDSENTPWENKCVTTPVYSSPFPLRCTQQKLSHC